MNLTEPLVFIVYLLALIAIGLYFFFRSKTAGEKEYFLGGRHMGPWVVALSAGAADMSAWVLMGLPTTIYEKGLGEIWFGIGLALGYTASWLLLAPRLRAFSIVCEDSITIPQYLAKRLFAKSHTLQVICAIVFLIAYTVYAASSIKACGNLFETVTGLRAESAIPVAAIVIVSYTFMGGFDAVCWIDFFQGLLMLGSMLIAPVFASLILTPISTPHFAVNYWNPFCDWKTIVSGLGWGLGYFGMPHIIIRFMSLKSQKDMKKSATIGISWTVLILVFAALIGILGRHYIPRTSNLIAKELVFISMVRRIFPALISGVLLSAILAAAMSTADSQLLAASSAFSSDVYKPLFRQNKASEREILWTGRIIVLVIAFIAMFMALSSACGTIMTLVSNAWGVFGAAFGPVILLSLYWKRLNAAGAIAGIVTGAAVDILWLCCLSSYGLYEIIPGFIAGLFATVIATYGSSEKKEELEVLYNKAVNYKE